ncbi:DUF397 domain-containing protein [Streptomyces ossamyceticus]|uniref:DUF397 domain-containing protein n=1 Tax=Streptomyces ossamyceticus TaxID=249581 RepID=A0ABV2V8M9_9ACTN
MSADPQLAPEPTWFKSSYSGANTTECVEAAFIPSGVLIRDSKRPAHALLEVSADAWTGFLAGAPHLTRAGAARTA